MAQWGPHVGIHVTIFCHSLLHHSTKMLDGAAKIHPTLRLVEGRWEREVLSSTVTRKPHPDLEAAIRLLRPPRCPLPSRPELKMDGDSPQHYGDSSGDRRTEDESRMRRAQ
jgi:hypothetical protein